MPETNGNIDERWYFMTTQGLKDILLWLVLEVYLVNLTTKPTSLTWSVIVLSSSYPPTCIVHAYHISASTLETKLQNMTKSIKNEHRYYIYAVLYDPLEREDKQVDGYNAVKNSDQDLKSDWREKPAIRNEYSTYCQNRIKMLTVRELLRWPLRFDYCGAVPSQNNKSMISDIYTQLHTECNGMKQDWKSRNLTKWSAWTLSYLTRECEPYWLCSIQKKTTGYTPRFLIERWTQWISGAHTRFCKWTNVSTRWSI